ncbi:MULTISPECIES: hypothetical protein [Terrabacteria group]|uniref:hypothetical protein n=1 Tax=Bacillati TaxID=1783272 RepID=UPI001C6E80AF|nr:MULTISPECIES: hypothetical protein [Terrabacteria group]MBW9213102.1 hypothetical protein [Trueperella sp. zg.1013]
MKKINALGMSALVAVMLLNGCGPKQTTAVAEKNDGQKETITTSNSKPQPEITKKEVKEEVKAEEKKADEKEVVKKETPKTEKEVSKVSTSTSTKKNNSTVAKVKSSKSNVQNVQNKKSSSNTNSKGKNTNKGNTSSNSKGKTKPVKKPSGVTNTSKPKPKACPYKNYDADGNCETHKKVCMTSEQVYQKYMEWSKKHDYYNDGGFTGGDADFDGCHVIFSNDGKFKAGED